MREKAKKGVTVHTEQFDTAACRFQIELANLHLTLIAVPFSILTRFYSKLRMGKGPYLRRVQFTQLDASALGFCSMHAAGDFAQKPAVFSLLAVTPHESLTSVTERERKQAAIGSDSCVQFFGTEKEYSWLVVRVEGLRDGSDL